MTYLLKVKVASKDYVLPIDVEPSDIRARWSSYCQDFDLVSYRDNLNHAFEMIKEAVNMVIIDDEKDCRDPFGRDPKNLRNFDYANWRRFIS